MTISFTIPFSRAWRRTVSLLFRPFEIEPWLVIGFTAWVSGLVDGRKGGSPVDMLLSSDDGELWPNGPGGWGADWISEHLVIVPLVILLGLFGLAVFVILLWLSARMRFVFLDNVAQRHTHVTEPWSRFARRGNSLFLWQLLYTIACVLLLLLVLVPLMTVSGLTLEGVLHGWVPFGTILITAVILLFLALPMAFIGLMLDDFIVPIMYARDLSATQAWTEFMPLLRREASSFILYALLILVASVAVGFALSVVGLATCCVGFLVFSIPYLGSVLLLPVTATYRAYSVAFLEQFDERYRILAEPAVDPSTGPVA